MRPIRLEVVVIAAAVLGSACDVARPVAATSVNLLHPVPYVGQHAQAALADLGSCTRCHGADYAGGSSGVSCNACHGTIATGFADWQTNCTFCHGTRTSGWTAASPWLAAPPRGVRGETLPSEPQVGAHQKHLGNGSTLSDGVACGECHAVPSTLAHVDGAAPLAFGPLAAQGGLQPAYAAGSCSATYCHGATLQGGANPAPSWTGSVACGDCHGSPPATGRHLTPSHSGLQCSGCHALVATPTAVPGILGAASAKALHADGTKNVDLSVAGTWDGTAKSCSSVACHSAISPVRYW